MTGWMAVRALLLVLSGLCISSVAALGGSAFDSKSVLKLTTKNFDEQVDSAKLTAIKFYAPWCGHCKKLAPTWKQLAERYKDSSSVDIAHIDCTKNATVCKKHQVGGYPKLVLFYNGKQHASYRGPRDFQHLQQWIDTAVKDLTEETAEL